MKCSRCGFLMVLHGPECPAFGRVHGIGQHWFCQRCEEVKVIRPWQRQKEGA